MGDFRVVAVGAQRLEVMGQLQEAVRWRGRLARPPAAAVVVKHQGEVGLQGFQGGTQAGKRHVGSSVADVTGGPEPCITTARWIGVSFRARTVAATASASWFGGPGE